MRVVPSERTRSNMLHVKKESIKTAEETLKQLEISVYSMSSTSDHIS